MPDASEIALQKVKGGMGRKAPGRTAGILAKGFHEGNGGRLSPFFGYLAPAASVTRTLQQVTVPMAPAC
ncbi:hypothetical protein [Janthinobacterium psychrotolerans]|uniref:hypothetical protein n=1 Tax=Janthinobacterium psychrotolerans TaxID=1747903 RepID=UPI0014959BB9|nr:hypothetical protein [Janthinobacterium psychrotolerans]